MQTEPFVVKERTDFSRTRLVDAQNQFHESVSMGEAREFAQEAGLDLVCFKSGSSKELPLCKVVDYGKWKYQQDKKAKQSVKDQKTSTKEVRFSPTIAEHDIQHKIKHVEDFMEHGNEVLLTMRFDTRRAGKDVAFRTMNHVVQECSGFAHESFRKVEGRIIRVRLQKKQVDGSTTTSLKA